MLPLLSLIHRKTKRTTMTIILYVDIVSQHHWYSINTSGLLTTILPCCSIRSTNNYHSLLLLLVLLLIRWYHLKKHHNNNLYRLKSIKPNTVVVCFSIYILFGNTTLGSQHCFRSFSYRIIIIPWHVFDLELWLSYHHPSMTRIRSRTHITFHSNFSPFSKQG